MITISLQAYHTVLPTVFDTVMSLLVEFQVELLLIAACMYAHVMICRRMRRSGKGHTKSKLDIDDFTVDDHDEPSSGEVSPSQKTLFPWRRDKAAKAKESCDRLLERVSDDWSCDEPAAAETPIIEYEWNFFPVGPRAPVGRVRPVTKQFRAPAGRIHPAY